MSLCDSVVFLCALKKMLQNFSVSTVRSLWEGKKQRCNWLACFEKSSCWKRHKLASFCTRSMNDQIIEVRLLEIWVAVIFFAGLQLTFVKYLSYLYWQIWCGFKGELQTRSLTLVWQSGWSVELQYDCGKLGSNCCSTIRQSWMIWSQSPSRSLSQLHSAYALGQHCVLSGSPWAFLEKDRIKI